MNSLKSMVLKTLALLEEGFDKIKYGIKQKFGYGDTLRILPYFGYGTQNKFFLKGRVLEEKRLAPANKSNSGWNNFVNMIKRLESDEVPYAKVLGKYQNQEKRVVADDEGYFDLEMQLESPVNDRKLWYEIDLKLQEPQSGNGQIYSTGRVLVPSPTAEYGVISDIDDTIIHSNVINKLRMLYIVFLKNAHTRLPFKGVAGFYQALHEGRNGRAQNPIFYVSSGPWNFYDLLTEFFEFHDLPAGPLFLRDIGPTRYFLLGENNRQHKLGKIQALLKLYPDLPFLLIGDNGEQDPEIYTEIAKAYPGRVAAIYIRKVKKNKIREQQLRDLASEVKTAGSELLVVNDTLAAANHARNRGWIADESLQYVREEKDADEKSGILMERKETK